MKPIISTSIRIRHPEQFTVGEGSIVDDYCYFSTRVRIGSWSHVANNCSVAGGAARQFTLGDYSSLSAGVRIWCVSDDYVRGIVMILPPGLGEQAKEGLITGDVVLGDMTAVGANSVIMPDNRIPEGTTIGALSFAPPRFAWKPWRVYAGCPIREVGRRDRDAVLRQRDAVEEHLRRRGAGA